MVTHFNRKFYRRIICIFFIYVTTLNTSTVIFCKYIKTTFIHIYNSLCHLCTRSTGYFIHLTWHYNMNFRIINDN